MSLFLESETKILGWGGFGYNRGHLFPSASRHLEKEEQPNHADLRIIHLPSKLAIQLPTLESWILFKRQYQMYAIKGRQLLNGRYTLQWGKLAKKTQSSQASRQL